VWLDLRSIPPDRIRHRFPNIIQVCQQWGIDVFQEPIPVAPAAHYWMGGILTDLDNRTTIAGLYALGETASTGVHGANRLASNSLLECLVFGAQLRSLELPDPPILPPVAAAASLEIAADPTVAEIRAALPKLVWQSAGICRNGRSLQQAIEQVEQWRQQFADLPLSQTLSQLEPAQVFAIAPAAAQQIREWSETRNLLDVAYLILKSAAFRQESRGGHYREDFPQTDSEWQVHTLLQGDRCWRSDWVGG
jgi:L-aspartate oxidase